MIICNHSYNTVSARALKLVLLILSHIEFYYISYFKAELSNKRIT